MPALGLLCACEYVWALGADIQLAYMLKAMWNLM